MISHAVYWYMHIFGIGLLMLAIGGVSLHAMSGGTKETSGGRRLTAVSHGLGLLLILTACSRVSAACTATFRAGSGPS